MQTIKIMILDTIFSDLFQLSSLRPMPEAEEATSGRRPVFSVTRCNGRPWKKPARGSSGGRFILLDTWDLRNVKLVGLVDLWFLKSVLMKRETLHTQISEFDFSLELCPNQDLVTR